MKLIDKAALVAEIKNRRDSFYSLSESCEKGTPAKAGFYAQAQTLEGILSFIDTLEVIDPYEQCIQYASIETGIKAHAEDYSFNIESELFNQLTKEQQALWRKEIEQAVISGGYNGLDLAKDPRYKENLETKKVDLEAEINKWRHNHFHGRRDKKASGEYLERISQLDLAKHFFELGLKTQHSSIGIPNIDDLLEEDGIDPDSKEAKIFKESYYMALERLKTQKGE